MKTLRKLAVLASAGLVVASLMACGDDDDDNPDNPSEGGIPAEGSTTDTNTTNPEGGGVDGGKDSGDGSVAVTSFPTYVQQLILTKTSETGLPEPETAWGTLADDEKYVFPATFFP